MGITIGIQERVTSKFESILNIPGMNLKKKQQRI